MRLRLTPLSGRSLRCKLTFSDASAVDAGASSSRFPAAARAALLLCYSEAEVCELPTWKEVEDRLGVVPRGPSYVVARNSEVYHLVASAHPLDPPEWHQTRCSWGFGKTEGVGRYDAPPAGKVPCRRGCF